MSDHERRAIALTREPSAPLQAGASDDQSAVAAAGLGDRRLAFLGVVGDGSPGGLIDRVDLSRIPFRVRTPIKYWA